MAADPLNWWNLIDLGELLVAEPDARIVAVEDVPFDAGWEVATARGMGINWEPLGGSWYDASAAGGESLAGALIIVRPVTDEARDSLRQ